MFNRLISNDQPRSRLLAILLVLTLLGLAFAPFLFPGVKALSVAAKVLIFVVLVAGFDLLLGYTGIVSFAHTMFFGIGAYGLAIALNAMGPTWGAIAVGLVGVVIALQPQGEGFFTWGALAVLAAALCYSVSAITGRLLSRTDSAVSLVFWSMAMIAVGAGLLAWPNWVPVRAEHGWLLLALAGTGFIAQLCITEAFRHGQASAVAPFEYTALAWGAGIDWLLWHTLPQAHTLIGASIIIASGLYLIHLERGQNTALPP